ncbi:hypothetical protein [Rhizobium sp. Root1204]|uniref:hypothetical protein n=1 Tax=Rhizobium sp. Root1204 TaxID=1736428 RepID=UPI000AA194AE|nr:hypothetical protein [Rhizobium sp. Root1204]
MFDILASLNAEESTCDHTTAVCGLMAARSAIRCHRVTLYENQKAQSKRKKLDRILRSRQQVLQTLHDIRG